MTKRKNLLRRRLIARSNKPREYGKQNNKQQNKSIKASPSARKQSFFNPILVFRLSWLRLGCLKSHSGRQQRGRYCPGKTTIGNEVSKIGRPQRWCRRQSYVSPREACKRGIRTSPKHFYIVIANMCTHPAAHGGLTRVRATRGADAPALRAAGKIRKRDKGHQLVPVSNPVRNACSHTHKPAHWSRQYALATAAVSAMP